jgi:hypothetical protein
MMPQDMMQGQPGMEQMPPEMLPPQGMEQMPPQGVPQ